MRHFVKTLSGFAVLTACGKLFHMDRVEAKVTSEPERVTCEECREKMVDNGS